MRKMRNPNAKISDPNEFVSNPGDLFATIYSSKVLPDGTVELTPSGKIDIKNEINSQRDLTDLAYIARQIENGNMEPQENIGFYGDMREFPKTFADMLQLKINAEESWYGLTTEIRQRFDNDFNKYFATAGSEDWFNKLGANVKKEEGDVKNDES